MANLNKQNKEAGDENRKLLDLIEKRDKQYKHSKKKLEMEIEKLKDRVKSSAACFKELPRMESTSLLLTKKLLINNINNNCADLAADSAAAKKLELYADLVNDYERKNRELLAELNEIKLFINHFYLNIQVIGDNLKQDSTANSNKDSQEDDNDEGAREEEEEEEADFSSEIINQPFENIYYRLNKYFQNQFNLINLSLFANKNQLQ
jgi:hypothetical protein